jgi:hypothetical protein
MRTSGRWIRVASAIAVLLIVGYATTACGTKARKDLVGTWRTQLTGYNSVAAGMTQYDQTVTFTDAGIITMDTTLPGELNHVTGRYTLSVLDGKPAITITWDGGVEKPSKLYYGFQGEKLLTSQAPGSLDASEELNVGNQDPVVYIPLPK